MSAPKPWLTVAEAAFLLSKDKSRIYRWIRARKVETRTSGQGLVEVATASLLQAESETVRGRPRHATSSV